MQECVDVVHSQGSNPKSKSDGTSYFENKFVKVIFRAPGGNKIFSRRPKDSYF